MSEVKRDVCHACVSLPRETHCPVCDPEMGCRKELDAQRLRADTAEAERNHAKEERDSYQRIGIAAEQRVSELEAALKYYADSDHYSTDDGMNWDSCSGEPANILWHEEQPWFIEDGSIARAALNPKPEAGSHE